MKRLLYVLPFFLVSCEKEIIEPAKYIEDCFGKPAIVDKANKKTNKLRLRKKRKRYEKINKNADANVIRSFMYSSGRNIGSDSGNVRFVK